MRSQDAWTYFNSITDKPFNGNVTPSKFAVLFNAEQLNYMDMLVGSVRDLSSGRPLSNVSPEETARVMDALSPFWKQRFSIQAVNGIAQLHNPSSSDYVAMPMLFLPGWDNPDCGSEAPSRYEVPLERIPASEWPSRTNPNRYNKPTLENPAFMTIDGGKVMVDPYKEINYLWATYIRKPRDITVAQLPDGDADPNAVNQDPEWNDLDTIAIINRVVGLAGVRESVSRWMQFPAMKGVRE